MRALLSLKTVSTVVMLLALAGLSACGFKLRGYQPLPPILQTQSIYIDSRNPYDLLAQLLTQILDSVHAKRVSSAENAVFILKVYNESFHSRPLSDSASSETKEYLLNYTVTYEIIHHDGRLLYGPKTITTARHYMVNETQVLSSGNAQNSLRAEIQRDAAYQMLNQLNSPDVASALDAVPSHEIKS